MLLSSTDGLSATPGNGDGDGGWLLGVRWTLFGVLCLSGNKLGDSVRERNDRLFPSRVSMVDGFITESLE